MDILANIALGFAVALDWGNLAYCFLGVTLGTLIGVLPGLGPLVTLSILLPLTFGMPAEGAIIMLAGIYYGAAYGGSTTAILINLPGESSSVVTCIDGYEMAKKGRGGQALVVAALASFFAGCTGTLLIAALGPTLSRAALQFGSPENFSLMLMALVMTGGMVHGSGMHGFGMALLGVLFGIVGTDINSGVERFTFGILGLADGIEFVAAAIGLFALVEIIRNIEIRQANAEISAASVGGLMPTREELRRAAGGAVRGTAVGSFFGLLPGAGMTVASFAAYLVEKRVSAEPHRFGRGAIEGVASPEAANNAAAQTAFIPTLTLGIPGSGTMALILGALIIQGIAPGPRILVDNPMLFWGLVASMWIGNLILVLVNLPLLRLWTMVARVPFQWLCPTILVFACTGLYTISLDGFDILTAAAFGLLGYVFLKLGCEPAPFILGFVLGPMLEENFKRSLLIGRGDPSIFITHPISAALLAVTAIVCILMIMPRFRRAKDQATEGVEG